MFVRPEMGYVRAKIGLTGQFDRSQPGNYLQPCAVSHNRARPYFPIEHGRGRGRGEVRARRVYLNVHSTGNVVDTE